MYIATAVQKKEHFEMGVNILMVSNNLPTSTLDGQSDVRLANMLTVYIIMMKIYSYSR